MMKNRLKKNLVMNTEDIKGRLNYLFDYPMAFIISSPYLYIDDKEKLKAFGIDKERYEKLNTYNDELTEEEASLIRDLLDKELKDKSKNPDDCFDDLFNPGKFELNAKKFFCEINDPTKAEYWSSQKLEYDRKINKELTEGETFEGQARSEINIMSPVILFDTNQILEYNYAYIPELQRYYSIANKNITREGLMEITFAIDVLMSFRRDILLLGVIADKQSMIANGDEYIDDGSLVTDNLMFTRIINYPDGFLEDPEYILITAG